jgi:Cu(I)/Ag(I) efflux system membrane fusion protein
MSDWIRRSDVLAALLLAALAAGAACRGGAPSGGVVTRAGGLVIEAALDPDPPRQEGNTLVLTVNDEAGAPVEGADVALRYSMPAMGAMPEMRGRADVEPVGAGRYRARFDLPMDGSWTLELDVRSTAASARVSYRMRVGSRGLTAAGGEPTAERPPPAEAEPGRPLPEATLEQLRSALAVYDELREQLAADRLAGLPARAARLAAALRAAGSGFGEGFEQVAAVAEEAARTAEAMGAAGDLVEARDAFGETTRVLMLLAGRDQRLREGWHPFQCPMRAGFDRWLQSSPEPPSNPYMGQSMPECGTPAEWAVTGPRSEEEIDAHARAAHGSDGGEAAYYTCSMHPSVRSANPGTCPICSMDLVPVTHEEVETGVIIVDAQRRQLIGVRTAAVRREPIGVTIRAVGKVTYDETRLSDVSVKYRGWIGTLHADSPGQLVRKGKPLFTLYSPELHSAQEELLAVLASQRQARGTSAPERADYLVEAARERLRLWDLEDAEIDRIAERGQAVKYLPITSPVTGYVVEKNVVAGAVVEPGMQLYRIAGLDRVWVEAEVYESELPLVSVGQQAEVGLSYLPGERFTGRVAFVYPYLQGSTRTGRVRIELANPGLELKPEMYADVTLRTDRGEGLVVPEEAVLYAGPRRIVFVDLGEGRLRPQEIEVGVRSGDRYEVLSGLEEGDRVVTSGNFLVAAESRLKSAAGLW